MACAVDLVSDGNAHFLSFAAPRSVNVNYMGVALAVALAASMALIRPRTFDRMVEE